MSEARRKAEEALAMYDRCCTPEPHEVYAERALDALRAILAEPRIRREVESVMGPMPAEATDGDLVGMMADALRVARLDAETAPTTWAHCPAYREGEPHADCRECGGFGAVAESAPADAVHTFGSRREIKTALAEGMVITASDAVPATVSSDAVREAALAPIRSLRITAGEIRAALRSVMPYGPGQRDEAFVEIAASAAADSLAALAAPRREGE
jgi:hypothetical protein